MRNYTSDFYDPLQNTYESRYKDFHYQNNSNSFAPDVANESYSIPTGANFTSSVVYHYGINGSLRYRHLLQDENNQPHEEFYLFDAHGNMNAYSDNMETYAYYSYDDAGQRTCKMTFANKSVGNNTQYFPHLEQEKISFYPNGFININQKGEYTKHYYAETQRIASKIGTGSHHNLCEEFRDLYAIQPHELDMLRYEAEDKIQQDLTFLVDPEAWVDIEYAYSERCNLKGGDGTDYESKLFFYHGNHLSSTQMITDINAKVVQQVLYAPFGEVITEHNAYWHNGLLPDYMFNAKELDEESGMYYYEARYYNPPTFISRDPLFEEYPTMSPYAYCNNNPVVMIDPKGLSATNFEDADGNLIKHVDDGSNAVFKLQNAPVKSSRGEAHFKFVGYENQGGADEININTVIDYSQEYTRDNFTNDANGTTYCNRATQFIAKSFASAAEAAGYSIDGLDFTTGRANDMRTNFPESLRLNTHGDAVDAATKTVNGKNLNLVIGSISGHVLTFTRDGKYSNIGGRGGNRGSSIQKIPWLSDRSDAQYFMIRAVKYIAPTLQTITITP
jgi:RHS repeat-associated protein